MNIEQKLQEMNVTLPTPPSKAGLYMQCKPFGDHLLYISGCGPDLEGVCELTGKLGAQVDIEVGQLAAKRCMLNALAILKRDIGDLDRIKSFVKMLAFIASDDNFTNQPLVANGATSFLIDVFGKETGCPTRSAIGVNVLPGDIPVEIELIVELKAE